MPTCNDPSCSENSCDCTHAYCDCHPPAEHPTEPTVSDEQRVPVLLDAESGYTTVDYWNAISGEGPLAYTWSDKPHRLLRDLVKFIEANRDNVKPLNGKFVHLTGQEMGGVMAALGIVNLSTPLQVTHLLSDPATRDKWLRDKSEPLDNHCYKESHDPCYCDECWKGE